MKRLIDALSSIFKSPDEAIKLGRWSLKNCDISKAATFYANRDHCGDTICKQPKRYDEKVYNEPEKNKKT